MGRIISAVFAIFIVVYVAGAVWRMLYNPIKTVSAVHIEAQDTIEMDGMIVREESTLAASASGAIDMQIGEGERAAKGDAVALIYGNKEALTQSNKKRDIDARIEKLQSLMNQGNEAFDLNMVDTAIVNLSQDILDQLTQSNYSQIPANMDKLKEKTMSREYIYRDKAELKTVIGSLQAERKKYANSAPQKVIYASAPGYYSHESDGYESVLKCSKISELTPKKYQEIANGQAINSQNDGTLGKIITEFYWDYVAVIDKTSAKRMAVGNNVMIEFDNHLYPSVHASVYWMSEAQNGKVTVALRVTEHISDFTVARKLRANVVVKTYTGLKVPREALRVDEKGGKGVYCLIDSQVKFKAVEPIFEKDSYYIVKYDSKDTKSLLLFDEIVVSAKELSDRKMVK